jgi:type VI secretion system protein ImpJ
MKFLSRVVWSEGMYLGPHHFQTQSRYFEDLLHFLTASLWDDPWGLLNLQLDEEAIRNGSAVLLHASGIMPDGLTFDIPECDEAPPATNILDAFPPTDAELNLFLAIPRRKDNGLDFDPTAARDSVRYGRMERTLRDETSGIEDRDITLGSKNLVILTEAQLTPELAYLPLARVLRNGNGGFVYDASFIPACLRIHASDALMLLVKRLLDTLEEKSRTIARGDVRPGQFQVGMSALEVANYWFLHSLNSAMPGLRHIYLTKRGHPEELFVELSRLAGSLCTFAVDSDPASLPAYDHLNLGICMRQLDAHIRRHLEIVVPSNFVRLNFASGSERYVQEADVVDERCIRRSRWILGIRSDIGEASLLRSVPQLVKVCSARFVPELIKRALPGLVLTHLPVPPSAMRAQADMQYFSISTTGPCWEHILQSRRVGVYIPGEIREPIFELNVILENA